jgi:hypothetical protein
MVWVTVISVAIFLGTILLVLILAFVWSRRRDIRAALKEHRRESRIAVDIAMELSNADEPLVHETASTQNVSRHGARVLTKARWRPNNRVLVHLPQAVERSPARIAYCATLSEHDFAIGLKFLSPIKWELDWERSHHPLGKPWSL